MGRSRGQAPMETSFHSGQTYGAGERREMKDGFSDGKWTIAEFILREIEGLGRGTIKKTVDRGYYLRIKVKPH
jgi:hypothetical protein